MAKFHSISVYFNILLYVFCEVFACVVVNLMNGKKYFFLVLLNISNNVLLLFIFRSYLSSTFVVQSWTNEIQRGGYNERFVIHVLAKTRKN